MERKFNDQQLARRKKLDDLVAKGINPFGNAYTRTANSKSIKDTYGACSKEWARCVSCMFKIVMV